MGAGSVGGVGGGRAWCLRVEEFGAPCVTGYYGDFVGVVEGEVGVDEDLEVGDSSGEGKYWVEESPGMGVCVEDYGEQSWGRFWSKWSG